MNSDRRAFNGWLMSLAGIASLSGANAEAGPWLRRRRRVRRRIRRRAFWRMANGRRLLVVPAAVAVGWELSLDSRVVVVREVREKELMVSGSDGKVETVEVLREDSAENAQELEGSEI